MPEYEYDVPEYFQAARLPNIGRYRTLVRIIRELFKNGVTEHELTQLITVRQDVLLEYYIALNVLKDMKENARSYTAARALVAHLHRCYVLMDYALGKVYAYRAVENEMSWYDFLRRREEGGKLIIRTSGLGLELLRSLSDQTERIKASEPEIRQRMNVMPKDVIKYWQNRVTDALKHLENKPLEKVSVNDLNTILGLSFSVERERAA